MIEVKTICPKCGEEFIISSETKYYRAIVTCPKCGEKFKAS